MATLGEVASSATSVSAKSVRAPRLRKAGSKTPTPPPAVPTPAPQATQANGNGQASKYKGLGTLAKHGIPGGIRRMEFQDRLLALNESPAFRRTDTELAAMMDLEHPGGVKIRPDHMRAIRRLYNAGRHTKNGKIPEVLSVEYGPDKKPLAAPAKAAKAVASK